MTTDPRRRRGDWAVNAELLAEEIEATWPVRLHQQDAHHVIGQRHAVWVVEAQAIFTPPLPNFPHSLKTITTVDRQYLTPYDRARYMALWQLWVALDALGVPPRALPQ